MPSDALREAAQAFLEAHAVVVAEAALRAALAATDPEPVATATVQGAVQDASTVPHGSVPVASADEAWPELANIIREVDGNHDLGADELAERILRHPRSAAIRALADGLDVANPCSCGHEDDSHYEGCLLCDRYGHEHGEANRD